MTTTQTMGYEVQTESYGATETHFVYFEGRLMGRVVAHHGVTQRAYGDERVRRICERSGLCGEG